MGKHERSAGATHDVELDHVDAGLESRAERIERVLRRERGRATVPDADESVRREHGTNEGLRLTHVRTGDKRACDAPTKKATILSMAQAATKPPSEGTEPPLDPDAVAKAFIRERARRVAREKHLEEQRKARIRYWIVIVALFFAAVILTASIWDQVKTLFGVGT